MRLLPRDRRYDSERLTMTVTMPIIVLCMSVLSVVAFNPWYQPEVAASLGMERHATLRVEQVERRYPGLSRGPWNCDHWVASGPADGRRQVTRACFDQAPTPQIGDELTVAVAARGEEAYLLARGALGRPWMIARDIGIVVMTGYGFVLGFRLLYIGWSSNWSWSSRRRAD